MQNQQTAIDRANAAKRDACDELIQAIHHLRRAQNALTCVEGDQSARLYDAIADAYVNVGLLKSAINAMQPTGYFDL